MSTQNGFQTYGGSPDSQYSSGPQDNHYSALDKDINSRMRVPKRIRVTGDNDDSPSVNWDTLHQSMPGRVAMSVPERILVAGGEHGALGRVVPREQEFEDSLAPAPSAPLCPPPPRTLTLDSLRQEDDPPAPPSPTSTCGSRAMSVRSAAASTAADSMSALPYDGSCVTLTGGDSSPLDPPSQADIRALQGQVGRLNRRIMALELDCQQRGHREMVLYAMGVAVCLWRCLMWLRRS